MAVQIADRLGKAYRRRVNRLAWIGWATVLKAVKRRR